MRFFLPFARRMKALRLPMAAEASPTREVSDDRSPKSSPGSPASPDLLASVRYALSRRRGEALSGADEADNSGSNAPSSANPRRCSEMPAAYRGRRNYVFRPYGRNLLLWELFGVGLLLVFAGSTSLWFGEDNASKINWRSCVAGKKNRPRGCRHARRLVTTRLCLSPRRFTFARVMIISHLALLRISPRGIPRLRLAALYAIRHPKRGRAAAASPPAIGSAAPIASSVSPGWLPTS